MPVTPETSAPPTTAARRPTRELLLRPRRRWFSSEWAARVLFQGNAAVSVLVLALITLTLFRDAIGFLPQNRENLMVYRRAGLEFVDVLRGQVNDHREISRFLMGLRIKEFTRLTAGPGLTLADANARLAPFDGFTEKFADAMGEQEALVGELSEQASLLKERYRVASDLREAKQHLLDGMREAGPDRAAALQQEAAALVIEEIDFVKEIRPLQARLPEIAASNVRLAAAMKDLAAQATRFAPPEIQRQMKPFPDLVGQFLRDMVRRGEELREWDPTKPVAWWESLHAFAFGRQWITASFWQDWYGILPLFAGSLLIAVLALCL
ncbi:MAG: hypothetical protein Q8J74_00865, partial [Candidatus Didemnitutus sp.]|nr:hypothetical protein [Candidatus Didemnitutus sp.]